MNYWQLLAFGVYFISVLVLGVSIQLFVNRSQNGYINRSIFLAESFLLGATALIGAMLLLSLMGLYKGPLLWGLVLVNYGWLLSPSVRRNIFDNILKGKTFQLADLVFVGLVGWFFFRNCYLLVTGDSHNIYLYVQNLWLLHATSIVGDVANNIGIFTPHFNAVPYALGIALFGQETFFAQLINISWSIAVLLMVFGYTSYRFNKNYGLIAVALVLFDEHFFYSGVNICVVINSALVAFLFGSIMNFWEGRRQDSSFRLVLGLVFAIQLMANKYQMAYIM